VDLEYGPTTVGDENVTILAALDEQLGLKRGPLGDSEANSR